jgi:predicted GNAT superfamily acetyltransferase
VSDITVRDLSGMGEFYAAEALQRDVWGTDDTEDPGDLMMVIQNEGGLVAGAFRDGRLIGYIFGFPTRDPAVQHSHRLAVHPSARGAGLALRLKRYQRAWCLARGIVLVRWTFDPLRHTNAHLNIGRLGAESSTYHADYYGEMKGINAGLPSDRLLAEWRLDAEHVAALASDRPGAAHARLAADDVIGVAIPENFDALLATDPDATLGHRLRVRSQLLKHFADDYAILGYDRDGHRYLLARR